MYLILTLLSIACNNMLISEDYKTHKHTHDVHEILKKKKERKEEGEYTIRLTLFVKEG